MRYAGEQGLRNVPTLPPHVLVISMFLDHRRRSAFYRKRKYRSSPKQSLPARAADAVTEGHPNQIDVEIDSS